MPRAQMQGTTGTGGGIVPTMQRQITSLETRLQNFERQILGTGGGGGNNRAGQAGGIRRRRTTRAAGGTGGGGTSTNFVTNLLRQHTEGLTAPQLVEMATAARHTMEKGYPYNSTKTLIRNHSIRQRGSKYYWTAGAGGTGTVAKAGTARTRTRRKAMGRAARAAG